MEANPNNPRPTEAQLCEQALAKARPWGLEAELMWSAIRIATKENSVFDGRKEKTMEEVLESALGEWDI